MTQKELREKVRANECRKYCTEIEKLKATNRRLLNENINLRTENAQLRHASTLTETSLPDWLISMMRLYGIHREVI